MERPEAPRRARHWWCLARRDDLGRPATVTWIAVLGVGAWIGGIV